MEKNIIIDDTLKLIDGISIALIVSYYDDWLLGEGYSLAYIKHTQAQAGLKKELSDKIFDIYRMFSN